MKEFIKKNFTILLAFALPIVLIVIVALSAYLPSLFISTKYNFVYILSCTESVDRYLYRCENYLQERYSIVDDKLVVNLIDPERVSDENRVPTNKENYTTRIFLHDNESNESREITLKEAQTLTLNSLLTSPDGITISSNYHRGSDFFFIFNGSSSYGYYLTKGKSKSKLNLINNGDRYYYQNNFKFIGWIVSEVN